MLVEEVWWDRLSGIAEGFTVEATVVAVLSWFRMGQHLTVSRGSPTAGRKRSSWSLLSLCLPKPGNAWSDLTSDTSLTATVSDTFGIRIVFKSVSY